MESNIQQLLMSARESFSTIRLDCVAVYHPALLGRALERSFPDFQRLQAQGALARLTGPDESIEHANAHTLISHDWRVWWRKPGYWRDDMIWNTGSAVINIVGDSNAFVYVSDVRTLATTQRPGMLARWRSMFTRSLLRAVPGLEDRVREFPLLDPWQFLRGCELGLEGAVEVAARDGFRVVARCGRSEAVHRVWQGVHEYEVVVDATHGILLRCAGLVEGLEAVVVSVRSVEFDGVIPDEAFTYVPPPGTRIVWVDRGPN